MLQLSFMVRTINTFTTYSLFFNPPYRSLLTTCRFVLLAENLTSEQYAGAYRPKLTLLSATRDALNPQVNTAKLRNRLWVIDHYRYRYGAQHTFWLHTFMKNQGARLWKYKFNYGVKALAAFMIYNSYQSYNEADGTRLLTATEQGMYRANILVSAAAATGIYLII